MVYIGAEAVGRTPGCQGLHAEKARRPGRMTGLDAVASRFGRDGGERRTHPDPAAHAPMPTK